MNPNNSNQYLPGVIAIPSSMVITAITNSYPMIVTVTIDPITESNSYQLNQLVKLFVPYSYGMIQANGLTGQILSVNGNDLYLDIDSRNFDVFSIPSDSLIQPASLSPSGSRNLIYNNTTNRVPFQSLNNRGN